MDPKDSRRLKKYMFIAPVTKQSSLPHFPNLPKKSFRFDSHPWGILGEWSSGRCQGENNQAVQASHHEEASEHNKQIKPHLGTPEYKILQIVSELSQLCETIQKRITSSLKENERGKKRNTEEMHLRGSEGRVGSKMKIQYGQNGHGKGGAASIQCGLQVSVCVTLNRTALAHQVWEPLS